MPPCGEKRGRSSCNITALHLNPIKFHLLEGFLTQQVKREKLLAKSTTKTMKGRRVFKMYFLLAFLRGCQAKVLLDRQVLSYLPSRYIETVDIGVRGDFHPPSSDAARMRLR